MQEQQHAELLGFGPERVELRIGELVVADGRADRRAAQPELFDARAPAAGPPGRETGARPTRTRRSGPGGRRSTRASRSFWMLTTRSATSRSAAYQVGLMLSASTSMPCSSITCRRWAPTSSIPRPKRMSRRRNAEQRLGLRNDAVGVNVDGFDASSADNDLAPSAGARRSASAADRRHWLRRRHPDDNS